MWWVRCAPKLENPVILTPLIGDIDPLRGYRSKNIMV